MLTGCHRTPILNLFAARNQIVLHVIVADRITAAAALEVSHQHVAVHAFAVDAHIEVDNCREAAETKLDKGKLGVSP